MTIISVSDFKILGIAAKAWMATLIPQILPSLRSPAVPDCLQFPCCHFTALPLCTLTALSAIPLWTLVHPLQWYSNVTPSRKPFPLARGDYCRCCQHLSGPLILRSVVCFEACCFHHQAVNPWRTDLRTLGNCLVCDVVFCGVQVSDQRLSFDLSAIYALGLKVTNFLLSSDWIALSSFISG